MSTPNIRFKGFSDAWKQRKLGDFCDMYNGDRSIKYPNAQDMVPEGIPFINAGDLENGRVNLATTNKITREKYDDLGGAKLQLGDILYCLRGTLGKNAYIDNFNEGTVASSLMAIRPKGIDGRYLFHILNSDIEYRQRVLHDEGAAQPNLSAKNVSGFDIPIPDIEEQKHISALLDNLDNLITLHQRKCDSLKQVKKYMLQKMFPKQGEKVPEIRFKGFTGDWEVKKLGDILYLSTLRNEGEYSRDDILAASLGTELEKKHLFFGLRATNESVKKYKVVQVGDIIFTKSPIKGYPNGIIRTCKKENGIVPTLYCVYHSSKNINSSIIQAYFEDKYRLEEYLNPLVNIGARNNVNITDKEFLEGTILLPNDYDEQTRIVSYLENLSNQITIHQRKSDNLKEIKKFMLQNMFPRE